jgi:hypothetical protein
MLMGVDDQRIRRALKRGAGGQGGSGRGLEELAAVHGGEAVRPFARSFHGHLLIQPFRLLSAPLMELALNPLLAVNFFDFSWINSPEAWIALLTLTVMEIVLGIDNIVFISILVDKLPVAERPRARFLGLGFAMVTRILLLLSISWVMQLKNPLFACSGIRFPART